jgi:general secretion pathway protein K
VNYLEAQYGIALLLVLSIILLMSGMAFTSNYYWSDMYALFDINERRRSQQWILLENENEMSKKIISEIFNSKERSNDLAWIFSYPRSIKINESHVYYRMVDKTNCFNIYSFNINFCKNKTQPYSWRVFKNLLIGAGGTMSDVNNILNDITSFLKKNCCEELNANIKATSVSSIKFDGFKNNLANYLSSHDYELLLKIVPLICTRNDNALLINVNALEVQQSKLIQAMFMNIISEEDIINTILAKPVNGWGSKESFFASILSNSMIAIDDIQKVKEVVMSSFSTDEYFITLDFWLDDKNEYYNLTNYLHVKDEEITVLQRRYGIGEPYDE